MGPDPIPQLAQNLKENYVRNEAELMLKFVGNFATILG
jgi:hypothetical protein